jgi:ribosome-associated protein
VAEALRVSERVVIPEAALSVKAVRSSGPGGQNVNKVASKVELRVDLDRILGLDPAARARLVSFTGPRQDAEGRLVVVSQRTRDQHRNLEDAREKVRALVARCLLAPRARRPSRPTRAAREARLLAKKRGAERKRRRSRPAADDD